MNNEKVYLHGREVITPYYLDKAIKDQDILTKKYVQDSISLHDELLENNILVLTVNANFSYSGTSTYTLPEDTTNLDKLHELVMQRLNANTPEICLSVIVNFNNAQLIFTGSRCNTTVKEASWWDNRYTDGSGNRNAFSLTTRYNNSTNKISTFITPYPDSYYVPYSYVKNNVSKVNTTAYEVTEDYNPAHKKYVDDSINTALGNIASFTLTPVTELPTENISTSTIYLLSTETTETDNIYKEYVYVNSQWELIGTTKVDLSNYYTKNEIDALFAEKLGNIDTLLTDIVDSTLDAEGKGY